MAEFSDLQSAARMRDLIERISSKVVDKKRPDTRIGRVQRVDVARQLAWIHYNGEDDDNLVKVRVAKNMIPTKTVESHGVESCDIVRVAGRPGSYYIIDFVRGEPSGTGSGGGGGGGGQSLVFSFTTASTLWTCVHNFDQLPVQVLVIDSSGDEIIGDLHFPDTNTVEISWYYPTSGTALVTT